MRSEDDELFWAGAAAASEILRIVRQAEGAPPLQLMDIERRNEGIRRAAESYRRYQI